MFKKIILIILIFSPLWYSLLIGYPVISNELLRIKEKKRPEISISKRCFSVGDFKQFMECFPHTEKIKGTELVNEIAGKTGQISPIFTVLLFVSLAVFIAAGIILIVNFQTF